MRSDRGGWELGVWLVVAAVTVGAGCGGEPVADREPAATVSGMGGTVVVASTSDIAGINPLTQRATDFNRDIGRQLFANLVEEQADFSAGPPSFEPWLAESWDWSEDRLDLTFHLRPQASWSDGTPLTADDVRWTWQAQIAPEVAWSYAEKKQRIRDVEIVDPHTVRFHFDSSYPDQLADANEGAILPRHVWGRRPFAEWRSDANWFLENRVANGAFVLASWEPNQQIVLRRNERYFDPERPRLDRVIFRIVPDKTSQIQQLLGGAVDYVQGVPPDQTARLEDSPEIEIEGFESRQYDYLCWNVKRPPFDDPEVRRALTLAIDRQEIIDTLYRGFARRSAGPILSTAWAFHEELEDWGYDPRVSHLILAKKGYADSDGDGFLDRDGERFSFELLANAGNRMLADAATMIQAQLRRAGIEARLRSLEFNSYVELLTGHEFDGALGAWNIDTTLDLAYAFHSRAIDGDYNFGSYSNPEVDRLIDENAAEADTSVKRERLLRLQELLHEEQPYTFLWEPQKINARNRRLHDTAPNALSTYANLEDWWLEP